jgi:hypothetical protein
MAALGTTDITTTLIKNTLGEDINQVSELCISTLVNMWSRFKPTRGADGVSTFWKGSDGMCGFALPELAGGVYSPTIWGYTKPISNYRLGDFRGYNHDSTLKPPIYTFSGTGGSTIPATLYPVDNEYLA